MVRNGSASTGSGPPEHQQLQCGRRKGASATRVATAPLAASEAIRWTAEWYQAWYSGAPVAELSAAQIGRYEAAVSTMPARACRFCAGPLDESVCDLGMQPPSNAFITSESLEKMECFYPLHAFVCGACFLVQLEEFESPTDIFTEYAYYSSFSSTWLKRAERFAETMTKRLGLDEESLVIEIGSNDGYLLQYFKLGAIPVLGIDPSQNSREE